MKRHERSAARLGAVQAVYQMIMNDQQGMSVVGEFTSHRPEKRDPSLFSDIVCGVELRRGDLEALLAGAAQKSQTQEPLLQAVLLCGAYELLAHKDIDAPVIISEYLNVAHAFFDQGESKLINGILDKVKSIVRAGHEQAQDS